MTNDLPIIQHPNSEASRRDFLKQCGMLAGFTLIGSVTPLLESCSNATSANVVDDSGKTMTVDVASLVADNQAKSATSPGGNPLLIVRLSANNYVTLLMVCQHEGAKPPEMSVSGTTISCSRHGSQYDLTGKVTRSPAKSNLDTFATTFDSAAKKVTITF